MITEDYVSFETAKLLEEKGFDSDECEVHYDPYNHQEYEITLQMAMKWLREVHKIFIRIIQSHIDYCCFEVYWNHGDYYKPMTFCNSYEQACESAIKYCLENLV